MKIFPNCKINIGLNVKERRSDGYHNIETLFYPVKGLHDEMDITPISYTEQGITLYNENIRIDCAAEDNLIVRCYEKMRLLYPRIGAVTVTLKKNIPFGAGLGGGSSDAAHTALALNELFSLNLTKSELANIVSSLGADCAFFICNTPCLAYGIGDELHPVDFSLEGRRLVMLKPQVAVSTKEAYSQLMPSGSTLITADRLRSWREFKNDFEKTVFGAYPILAHIKTYLLDMGAEYAAMSGSGSTVFGIFKQDANSSTCTDFRIADENLASMVIFNDTL